MGPFDGFVLVVNDGGTATPDSEAFFMTVKDAGPYYAYVAVPAGGTTFGTYHLSVAVFPASNNGLTCTTYTSTDVPQTIPDGPGLVTSTITIPGNPRIADLDVAINLTHNLMVDLDVNLVSPAGNDNGLFNDIGATTVGGVTAMDLVVDDEAAIPLGLYTVLSGMHFQPELNYRLSWFDGEDAGGTWTLTLRDDLAANGGTLNGWSITVCEPAPLPQCPAGFDPVTVYSSDFELDDGGFTHSGTADEWERGLPSFIPITTCNSGSNCWKTDLDNTYNASSSQDLLSPIIDLTGAVGPGARELGAALPHRVGELRPRLGRLPLGRRQQSDAALRVARRLHERHRRQPVDDHQRKRRLGAVHGRHERLRGPADRAPLPPRQRHLGPVHRPRRRRRHRHRLPGGGCAAEHRRQPA